MIDAFAPLLVRAAKRALGYQGNLVQRGPHTDRSRRGQAPGWRLHMELALP